MLLAAEHAGRGPQSSGARANPIAPMRPPASFGLALALEPGVGRRRPCRPCHEPRPWIAWRIDQALDVAAVRQNEGASRTAVQPRSLVHAWPRRDVIGEPSHNVSVDADLAHVDPGAANAKLAGGWKRIRLEQGEEVGVKPSRQSGRVVVPEQDVVRGGIVSEQVVVDDVVPYEVVGPHPREHLGEVRAFDAAAMVAGVTNSPAVVFCTEEVSSTHTVTVAEWTLRLPRAARYPRNAVSVMPPEHAPQTLTSGEPVISRIASTVCS